MKEKKRNKRQRLNKAFPKQRKNNKKKIKTSMKINANLHLKVLNKTIMTILIKRGKIIHDKNNLMACIIIKYLSLRD